MVYCDAMAPSLSHKREATSKLCSKLFSPPSREIIWRSVLDLRSSVFLSISVRREVVTHTQRLVASSNSDTEHIGRFQPTTVSMLENVRQENAAWRAITQWCHQNPPRDKSEKFCVPREKYLVSGFGSNLEAEHRKLPKISLRHSSGALDVCLSIGPASYCIPRQATLLRSHGRINPTPRQHLIPDQSLNDFNTPPPILNTTPNPIICLC